MKRVLALFLLTGCATTRVETPRDVKTPLHLQGSGVVYDFGGAELAGPGTAPDEFTGTAIVVEGGRDVTIRNVKIRG